jgi:hypothetical protein
MGRSPRLDIYIPRERIWRYSAFCTPFILIGRQAIGPAPVAGPDPLDHGTSAPCGEVNHQQDNTDDEENPCDLRCNGGNACRTENARDQPDNEKNKCVIQHWDTSLSLLKESRRCAVRFFGTKRAIGRLECRGGVVDWYTPRPHPAFGVARFWNMNSRRNNAEIKSRKPRSEKKIR